MPLQPVAPVGGPPAKGPYSPAIRAGNLLFVSGQIASDPAADLATQTRQCLDNLRAVLQAGGATLQQVAKVTLYLSDPEGWAVVNPIYAECFGTHKPARAIVPTAAFPGGYQIEIDAIAVLGD